MASTFSPSLRLELIGDGDQSGIWGQTTNNNLGGLLEQAISGVVGITMFDANYTMTNFNGVVDEARNQVIVLTGTLSAQRNLVAPLVEKTYILKNTTTGGFGVQIIGSSGTGVIIPNGTTTSVYCDGTNFYPANTGSTGNQTVNGNLTVTGTTTLVGALSASTATFSGAISSVNPSFTGTPTAPTAAAGTSNTQIATTAYADSAASSAASLRVPSGVILLWSGSIASIPTGWLLCNGSSGTPDLRDRFVVGAGSSYAVGSTGGAATYTLSVGQLPNHTHSLTASGTTSTVDINHTHSGTTATVDINHTHSGTSGGMNQNAVHSHGVSDPGHTHGVPSGGNPNSGQTCMIGPYTVQGLVPSAASTTNISIVGVNIDHTHSFTSNGMNSNNVHSHTFSTGLMSNFATHNHTVTVTGTSGGTGSGDAIENRPPYFALAYIMKS